MFENQQYTNSIIIFQENIIIYQVINFIDFSAAFVQYIVFYISIHTT